MRVPVSKIYRAFPELDRFSDEQCEMYVARARSRRRASGYVMLIGATFAGIAASIFLTILVAFLIVPLAYAFRIRPGEETASLLVIAFVGADIVAGFVVGFLVRDTWLRRAIQGCIDAAKCANCDYSLLGLPLRAGVVTCPECGTTLDLVQAGLMPADLLSTEQPSAEHPT